MEGYSEITYKEKTICYSNYSIYANQKEKMMELLKFEESQWVKHPQNSILALINVTNISFDMETLNKFKENIARTAPYEKKMALVGITGLLKTAYNFVFGLTPNQKEKAFDTEEEALEWLVREE